MMRILLEMEEEERAATDLTDDEGDDDDEDNDDDDASNGAIVKKNEAFHFVVKRQGALSCVQTRRLKFLDICNFIAPGFSYSKYLKAFGCEEEKGFFPYEWMDSLKRLDETSLPPRDAFANWLRNSDISEADYDLCRRTWREKGMRTFADFLVWYNNLDVKPMLEALEKQSEVYKQKGIDMLKDAISLPGLAVLWKFYYTDKKAQQGLRLLQPADDDLYPLIKDNIVGGPSIVFHRYHEKDATSIRRVDYGSAARPCKKILGVDANALYLYCMMQPLPEGPPRRYCPNDSGVFEETLHMGNSKTAFGWLAWLQRVMFGDNTIQHAGNGQETRVGKRQLPVDGFCAATNTVYQFHGCFWHKHPCPIGEAPSRLSGSRTNEDRDRQRYEDTLRNDRYIRALGYKLVSVWECEWEKTVNDTPIIKGFLRGFFKEYYPRKRSLDRDSIISEVRDGRFFGLIECDIRVPDDRLKYFSEMSPIFKNVEVGREHDVRCSKNEYCCLANSSSGI